MYAYDVGIYCLRKKVVSFAWNVQTNYLMIMKLHRNISILNGVVPQIFRFVLEKQKICERHVCFVHLISLYLAQYPIHSP